MKISVLIGFSTKMVLCLCLTFGIYSQVNCQVGQVMSYNIRFDNPGDSINKWDNRKLEVTHLIKYYSPEIIGIQEGLVQQLKYLDDHLPNYGRIGVGRDDGMEKGEFSPIFYDKNILLLKDESTFWLSQTSDKISVGWDASMERICTFGLFENRKTKQQVLVFNTHYDHIGEVAKEKSSELILEKINEVNVDNLPVILMGDFNAELESRPVKVILEEFDDAAQTLENGIYGPTGTFTGFHKNKIPETRIDYVFVKGMGVLNYRHVDDKMKNNNYISDHLPVLVTLK